MNALVLFRSYHGNTKQVAEAIARHLRERGHLAVVQGPRRRLPEVGGYDRAALGNE
jgi:menaquinone-dependent protoporphyrinogen IX oxidase